MGARVCRTNAGAAVDLDTGAVVAVTLLGGDQGDTTTLDETLCEAGMAMTRQSEHEAEVTAQTRAPEVNVAGWREQVTRTGQSQRRGGQADEGVRSAQLHSGQETERAAELGARALAADHHSY